MYQQRGSLADSAQQNFVKKVYSILSVQLAITMAVVWANFQFKAFAKFQANNNWCFWLAIIGTIVTLLALFLANITKKVPINYVVMLIFTLFQSYLVSYTCSIYQASSVLLAAVATLAATLGLTYYAMTTKQDFTSRRFIGKGMIYSLSWIILSVSLINIFFIRSNLIATGIAGLFAIIYSFYILYDTQMILGGKNRNLQLDDYVLGATILYMDIISLFLKILRILGKKKDD